MSLWHMLLPERGRETIAGDLLEERRARIAEDGVIAGQSWFALQVLSFVPQAVVAGLSRRLALSGICLFTALCGGWLGTMELLMRHPGYLGREWIGLLIVGQAAVTLCTLVLPARALQVVTMAGTCGILWLAGSALFWAIRGAQIEGYILVISVLLVLQTVLTWFAMMGGAGGSLRKA